MPWTPWKFIDLETTKTIQSKLPIDFTFSGYDDNNRLQVQIEQNKGAARKIDKNTPRIYYDKTFCRKTFEEKRKTMLVRNPYEIVSQNEFRKRITKFPNCFILVDLAKERYQWFESSFPGGPKIMEFIQIRRLPENGTNDMEPIFNYGEDWFEIDENDKFYPETGMYNEK